MKAYLMTKKIVDPETTDEQMDNSHTMHHLAT